MGDAHYSAYGRGGWYGDKDKRKEEEVNLAHLFHQTFAELERNRKKEELERKINEILKTDQELGSLIGRALSNALRGSQPFGFIPKKAGNAKIQQKIQALYPDVYQYILQRYKVARDLDEKGLL